MGGTAEHRRPQRPAHESVQRGARRVRHLRRLLRGCVAAFGGSRIRSRAHAAAVETGTVPRRVLRRRRAGIYELTQMTDLKTLLLIAAISVATLSGGAPGRVADKVVPRAVPFPLGDVRLLAGPFRDAMVRDQQYLLDLDPDRLLHNFRVNAGLPSSAQPLGGWEAPDVELRGHTVGQYLSALA